MTTASLEFPPLDYSLLFPDILDFHMDRNPSFPIFLYTKESAPYTPVEISFLEFGRAAHRVAHALRPSRQGREGEIAMIIANTDTVMYHAILVGLFIAGWVPFPVSPRNSTAAVVNMMEKTNCSYIVTIDHAHKALIDDIRREYKGPRLSIHEAPTLQHAFPRLGEEVEADPFVPYPPPLRRPDLDSPAIYIHSSGSTGFPKPIAHSHRIQIQWFAQSLFRRIADLPPPRRVASMTLPSFHVYGIATQLYVPMACLATTVVYAPRTEIDPLAQPVIPTSDNMVECLKKISCNIMYTVPTFLERISDSEEAVATLKKLYYLAFGGGPLPAKVGNKLWSAGLKLANAYGGTEFGAPAGMPDMEDIADGDWMWIRFAIDLKTRWVSQGDDTFELQFLSPFDRQMAVENLPDVKGYSTRDLFVKHPTKDMWKIVGRADDVITLASGEKTVPPPMEDIIQSSQFAIGVVMFGRGRNQVGVLIEPRHGHEINVKDDKAVAEFRNQIWPAIEEANKNAPAFSRIFKEMILITDKDKPMLRAAKGSIQRKATLNAYEGEINALYDTVEASSVAPDGSTGPSDWTTEALEEWFLEHARIISSRNHIDPNGDMFAQGFDSLGVTYLRNRLLGALRRSPEPEIRKAADHVPLNVIFENPTIRLLSSRIAALIHHSGQAVDIKEQHKQAITAMIEKYAVQVDRPLYSALPVSAHTVLITGTTGSLGSLLLSELLRNPSVRHVFAFNRPSTKSIEERHRLGFSDRGIPTKLLDSHKVTFIEADASLEKCGLSPARYEKIRRSVTLIIHNAWRLDFNMSISSFEENIRASRNLVDLGLNSSHRESLRYLFTSSIASAQSWDNSQGPFPEEVQLDPSFAIGSGYGESKYAVERIIVRSGLHATSLRIGQIAGGAGGSWATTDWFPIIVKSSIALGVLPEAAGLVSWLRGENVANAILEIAFGKEVPPAALNIVNPRGVPWTDIIGFVRRSIIKRKGLGYDVLPIVPFGEWFALLEKKAENAVEGDLAIIPAIKLLEFFRTLAQGDRAIRGFGVRTTETAGTTNFSTTKAQYVSPTMANMQAIGEVEADEWVGYWISKGAF